MDREGQNSLKFLTDRIKKMSTWVEEGGVKIEKIGDIFYGWFLKQNSSAYTLPRPSEISEKNWST